MKGYIFLLTIIILALGIPIFINSIQKNSFSENFENKSNLVNTDIQKDILLTDSYPWTGNKGITNNDANSIWWHYPIFELGSYDQITNNLKYPNNPDEGTCMPASICGALYKEKQLKSNYIKPLPPVDPNAGTRVGYFTTDINLLPFRTDVPNILY
jgi:hypothetical protein